MKYLLVSTFTIALLACFSIIQTTTQGVEYATTSDAPTTTSLPATTSGSSTLSEKQTTPAPPGTVEDLTEAEDELTTSTIESLSVNSDEANSTIYGLGTEESSGDIEPKSISHNDNGANQLGQSEPSAKLEDTTPSAGGEDGAAQEAPQAPRPASAHLNMSLIDQIYQEGRKDEQETVESWQRMGKKLKRGISGIIGAMVPYALNMSAEAKISSNCSGAMLKWVLSMNQLKSWALRMLDASGKPIAGMLEGSMTLFGNYRQCLKIRAPDDDEIEFAGEFREYFRGKYCIVQAKPWLPEKSRFYNLNTKLKSLVPDSLEEENPWYERTVFDELSEWALAFNFVNIRMDVCVPSLCSREDIQKAINFILKGIDLKARVLRCEMDSASGSAFGPAAVESGDPAVVAAAYSTFDQQQQTSWFPSGQLGWLLVPASAVCVVLLATAASMAMGKRQKASKLNHTIKSLSLKRSVSSHLNVDYDQLADDKPLALYGLRFILVLWVLLVESAVNLKFEYLRELLMLKDLIFWWPMQLVVNSTLQFDSIILLTAFTMSYKNCLNEGINSAKTITKFVLDKYVRLMPSIMLMVALVILLPLIYRGPVWTDYVTKQSAVCQSTGWLNSVFLQNYLPYQEICLPQTWLVCIELQLVLLMAPVVFCLNKNYMNNITLHKENTGHKHAAGQPNKPNNKVVDYGRPIATRPDATRPFYWRKTVPGTILIGCIAIGMAASFYNVFSNDLPPSWFYTMADPDSKAIYFSGHLMRLWTHVAVFAMGILAGIECRRASIRVTRCEFFRVFNLISHSDLYGTDPQKSLSSSLPPVTSQQADPLSAKSSPDPPGSTTVTVNIPKDKQKIIDNINRMNECNCDAKYAHMLCRPNRKLTSILLDILGCLLAVGVMGAIIFSTHEWSLYDLPKPLVAGLFDVTSRFLWSLGMIWILYMVSVPKRKESGGRRFSPLAKMLGHPMMVSLGKLSFLIYLIHPFVHTAVLAIQEQPIYSSWLMLFHILIGNITITVILASIVSLFVEMPCRNLFRRCGTSLLLTHTIGGRSSYTSRLR